MNKLVFGSDCYGQVAISCHSAGVGRGRKLLGWILTAVVAGGLSLTAKALVYQGLTNTPSGSATLSTVCCVSNLTSGGQDGLALIVTNLGSSGQDGVAINLPANLAGLDVQYEPLDVSNSLPAGAYVQEQLVGTGNGVTNGVLGTVTVTKQGGTGTTSYGLSANFSPLGASTCTVQAYLNGVMVAQATGQSNQPQTAESLPDSFGFGSPPANAQKVVSILWGAAYLDWTVATSITFAGGTNVNCDHLYITPENVTSGSAVAALQITASQVPALTIVGENASLSYQGLVNTTLGSAAASIPCCVSNLSSGGQDGSALVITNLGSSGQDGVSIALPAGLAGVDVGIEPLDVSNTLPVEAYVQEQVVGVAPGITNGVLGTVTVTKAGTTNYVVSANFSPLGSSSYTVRGYLQGVLVAQTTNQNGGALASCFIWPLTFDKEVSDEGGTSWTLDWNLATTVALTGSANVTCDRLFITPNNAAANTATAFEITASQVPSFTIYSENASLVYQGLTNTSVGDAAAASIPCCVSNLSSGGQDGSALIITNLGSSGQDGLSIALPGGQSALNVSWLSLDAANTLPVGAYVQEQAIGTANGVTNGSLGAVTVTKDGTSNYVVSADFSPMGASNYTVQAYFQGVLVAQATNQNGATLAQAANLNFSFDIGWTCCPWTFHMSVDWGIGGTSAFVGTTRVTCDHLDITPDNVSLGSAPTALQITASQVPALTIIGENASLSYQGLANTSLGSATVVDDPQDGSALIVTNLGSSGQDGVGIAMPANLTGLDVGIDPLDVSNTLPVGTYLQGQVVGTANGITNGVLGTVTVTKEGGTGTTSYEVSANYSAIGASNYTVQAYLQGVLVAQATNQPGASLANFPDWPDTWGFHPGLYIFVDWYSATSISLAGANVTCDHLYMRPVGTVTGSLSVAPSALQIVASQVPAFTIISENVSLVYQGLTNTSLGQADIYEPDTSLGTPSTSILVVSNLSSSGQDGVSMAMPAGLTALDVGWQNLDPSNSLPVGAYIQGQAVGTANGITNGILGTLTVTKECAVCGGTNYLAVPNFSPAGASSYTVQAYLSGVLVAQATNPPGASLPFFPDTIGISNWNIYLDYNSATSITIAGASVSCDHLYMRPVLPKGATLPGAPSAFQIVASQVPSFTMTSVAVSPWLVSVSLNNQTATLQWYGTGVLQGSTNLTTWIDITNATSPYAVTASSSSGPSKFYRLIFRP